MKVVILVFLLIHVACAQIRCTVKPTTSCYTDITDENSRLLANDVKSTSDSMTRESCAAVCFDGGANYAGVSYGGAVIVGRETL